MNESQRAKELAERVLSDEARDPDSDVSVLARQHLRALERLQAVEKERDEWRKTAGERLDLLTKAEGRALELLERLQKAESEKKNRPQIVCICGSSRFCDLAAVHAWNYEKMGVIALSMHLLPDWYWKATNKVGNDHGAEQEGVAHILDELHLRKIDLCDFVFVVNKDGYIGERTLIEIEYAKSKGKRIEYMEALQPKEAK